MTNTDIATWIEILTPIVIVVGALWRYERRLTRRLDAQDAEARTMRDELARQFGGNGNGLRQAVDGINKRFDDHIELHHQNR